MKKSLSGVMIFNIIIIFLLAIFALLSATFSYAKAYKVNTRIVSAIEKYEGYNELSLEEINKYLGSLGYLRGVNKNCAPYLTLNGVNSEKYEKKLTESYYYCVYKFSNSSESIGDNKYYSYAVITYISLDLPIVGEFKIAIKAKTNRIYDFSK